MEMRRHNAAFCGDCFVHHCHEQVRRAVDDHRMIGPGERVLVAVPCSAWGLSKRHLFAATAEVAKADLQSCSSCGAATPGDVRAFCKLRARAGAAS